MARLDPDQRERLSDLAERRAERAAHRRANLQAGEVVDHAVPSAHTGVADSERTVAVAAVHDGDLEQARDHFGAATEAYQQGIDAALAGDPWATAHQKVPEYCQEALVTAMLAGDPAVVTELAATVRDLGRPESFDDGGFHAGQYYLAQTLADATEAVVTDTYCEEVATRFEDAPTPIALYADGIVALARGLATGDGGRTGAAIETLGEHHDADRHADNVVEAVLAPAATAAMWLARHHGHAVTVENPRIPEALVTD